MRQIIGEESPERREGKSPSTALAPMMAPVTEKGGEEVLTEGVMPETDGGERETERGEEATAERKKGRETKGESEERVVKMVRKEGVAEAEMMLPERDGGDIPVHLSRLIAQHLTIRLVQCKKRRKRVSRRR